MFFCVIKIGGSRFPSSKIGLLILVRNMVSTQLCRFVSFHIFTFLFNLLFTLIFTLHVCNAKPILIYGKFSHDFYLCCNCRVPCTGGNREKGFMRKQIGRLQKKSTASCRMSGCVCYKRIWK